MNTELNPEAKHAAPGAAAPAGDNGDELFPVVDASGRVIGSARRRECHGGSMLLHPVVHLHLFDADGRLYLQKRPAWKDIQPGRWDTAVGGHVAYGETIDEALRREAREELGLESFEAEFVRSYVFRSEREQELVYVHRCRYDGEVRPSRELGDGAGHPDAQLRIGGSAAAPLPCAAVARHARGRGAARPRGREKHSPVFAGRGINEQLWNISSNDGSTRCSSDSDSPPKPGPNSGPPSC